jgi:hypothetical protein
MYETIVYVPIRAYQMAEDGAQYAVVEWIADGMSDSCITKYDDSHDSSPSFCDWDGFVTIRKTLEGHLVCDLNVNGAREAKGLPFAIHAPECWPDEWFEISS